MESACLYDAATQKPITGVVPFPRLPVRGKLIAHANGKYSTVVRCGRRRLSGHFRAEASGD